VSAESPSDRLSVIEEKRCEPSKVHYYVGFSPNYPSARKYAGSLDRGLVKLRGRGGLELWAKVFGIRRETLPIP